MKISKRAISIIFGILAAAFAIGTIFLFTPQGNPQQEGRPILYVNGQPIHELELMRKAQTNPLFTLNPTGVLRPLIDTYFLEQVITLEALTQDAARIRVSNAEVRKQVEQLRERLGVTDREGYDRFLQSIGYTDSQLRGEIRTQLRIQKRIEEIRKKVKLADEEARFYYELHKSDYAAEDRVKARQIVLDDRATAEQVYKQLIGGADFAELARQHSKVAAEQGGAVGAEPGSSEPGPVTRLVFPSDVAEAVFRLKSGGMTEVIETGGRFYIVKVEEFLPGGDVPYEEVAERVKEDALQVKQNGAVEGYIREVRERAVVKFTEEQIPYEYQNPEVAKVGDKPIKLAEVIQVVFSDQQVPQLIQQGLGELAVSFFFPAATEQLVVEELLVQQAEASGQPFIGTRAQKAQDVQLWKTKDVTVTPDEVRAYYEENPARFSVPASAAVKLVNFKDKETADKFREKLLAGDPLEELAKGLGGELSDLGTVNPGSGLPPLVEQLVFESEADFDRAGDWGVSEVVELPGAEGEKSYMVVLVKDKKAEVRKPFEEVKDEAEQLALAAKRAKLAAEWIDQLKQEAGVENKIVEVLESLKPKEEPATQQAPEPGAPAEEAPAEEAPAGEGGS
ncbi:MAG TPA: peptidyl-prolyl cis-trans isomerase [Oceanithermus profundus]|uniref:peptidylprolyl isomerase n=1 Tax=Oceanithermus profundus TaxID=187137 RepID=A0A7C4VCG5_9DEIN|nr:peptidyl-prolyl cis-trans isomerase [Oceanithermus profundus]